MPPSNCAKGPAVPAARPFKNGDASQAISGGRDNQPQYARQDRPLIDKRGRRYSEAVLRNWSPAMLRIMGVRRDGGAP